MRNSWLAVFLPGILSVCSVVAQPVPAIRGRVSVEGQQPLAGVVVRFEVRGQTVVTNTNKDGEFVVKGWRASQTLVSVLQGDRLLYRAIENVSPSRTLVITLSRKPSALSK